MGRFNLWLKRCASRRFVLVSVEVSIMLAIAATGLGLRFA